MIALYQHLELSRRGLFALIRRHGDVVQTRAALGARRRRLIDRGAIIPTGNARNCNPAWGWSEPEGPTLPELMRALGIIPSDDRAYAERVVIAVGRYRALVGAPVDDDLDADGACRCGCGYHREVERLAGEIELRRLTTSAG